MFSLYVHIPYCAHKCPYCDFNVHVASPIPEEEYVSSLIQEIRHYSRESALSEAEIETVYFGGGTPSLFSSKSFARVLKFLKEAFPFSPSAEISMEANPSDLSARTLLENRELGINRISVGAQSFFLAHLKTLGRDHSPEEIDRAIGWINQAGFENFSLDLMFGIPGQTVEEFREDLHHALSLNPTHLSTYNLTYEEGTPFFKWKREGLLKASDEEVEVSMMEKAQETLSSHGYVHYEVSNYARPGWESRHNTNIWRYRSYLGIGAGAHSFLQREGNGHRWSNERFPREYMKKVNHHGYAIAHHEEIPPAEAMEEFLLLGLRLREGIRLKDFSSRFGRELLETFPRIPDLLSEGFLTQSHGSVSLTRKGMLVLDTLLVQLILS
jgi:oxygen-independent coproporphyrinogen-3 oxidase